MEYICTPEKIALYINGTYKTAAQVKAETGCDALINGGLYDMTTYKPVCHLKADGKVLAADEYKYWGYGWDTDRLTLTQDPGGYDNYICCVCLVREGKPEELYYDPALGGARPRTAIGTYGDGRVWLYADRTTPRTPEQLREYAVKQGVRDAVMLDGGGSTQGICPAETVTAERRVQNFICVWDRKEEENMDKPEWWTVKYITENDGYKYNGAITGPRGLIVHSTAWPGYDADAIFDDFNRPKRGASIHGAIDDKKFIQMMPFSRQAGHVGSGSRGTLNTSFLGIEICEPSGIKYNKSGSAIISYDPPAGYFEAVRDKAVELYAYLCGVYNIDPLRHDAGGGILGHYEAHALGYGDNHADPQHWWELREGYTMDDFRRDVYNRLNDKEDDEMSYEQFKEYMERYMSEAVVSEPSAWAKEACDKAVEKGIMKGNGQGAYNFQRPLTREAYIVMQDRAGLL